MVQTFFPGLQISSGRKIVMKGDNYDK